MPDIEIVKLKLRRGTDAQRQAVTLEQGELGYTTDAKRVWVGDGFTIGGNNISNIIHTPMYVGTRTDLTDAVNGDLVYEDMIPGMYYFDPKRNLYITNVPPSEDEEGGYYVVNPTTYEKRKLNP